MHASSDAMGAMSAQPARYPPAPSRFDWIASSLAMILVSGLLLDTWAHTHGKVDATFFTPWHGILYTGMVVTGAFLGGALLRFHARGYAWRRALPHGYGLSLLGVFLFAAAGLLDLAWHTLVGIEVNLETLLSPTHLLLAFGGVLIVTGPLRAAWYQVSDEDRHSWRALGPALLSATALLSVLTLLTNYAHPLVAPLAAKGAAQQAMLHDIYVAQVDGTGQTRLTVNPGKLSWGPAWPPDGAQVAFTIGDPTTQTGELYLARADGSDPIQLTHAGRNSYLPAWSPDGARITFLSQLGAQVDTAEVNIIDVDGRNHRQLTKNQAQEYGTSWSPDGTRIVFGSRRDGSWRIYLMQADGSEQIPIRETGGGNAPAWSPDGGTIAFTSDRTGTDSIYLMTPDGGNVRRLTMDAHHNDNAQWSPDGAQIAFTSNRDGANQIYRMNADGSDATNVTNNPALIHDIPAWSPDGRTISYTAVGHDPRPPSLTEPLGVSSILLQSALLMGLVCVLVRRWRLPFGALTLIITLNSVCMVVLRDQYLLLPAALGAGLVADLLVRSLRPSSAHPRRFHGFAFAAPVVLYGLYFLTVFATAGVTWSIMLIGGSVVVAGIVGLLVSLLLVPPTVSSRAA